MRTTIDLPEDLHTRASSIARDTSRTLSEVVAELMRRALGERPASSGERSERTGLPTLTLGRTVTTEDVRSLDDDR